MVDFSKASDVNKFFGDLIEQIANVKIIGVYAPTYFMTGENSDIFMQDENVYICFENKKCLVVEYKFVNKLSIAYRSMTEEEIEKYSVSSNKDIFNFDEKIFDYYTHKVIKKVSSQLDYASLQKVEVVSLTKPYSAWVDGDIEENNVPTEETFEKLRFVMSNQKSFCIVFDDAESDGYSLLWSDDAEKECIKL